MGETIFKNSSPVELREPWCPSFKNSLFKTWALFSLGHRPTGEDAKIIFSVLTGASPINKKEFSP
ncbi:MAG: hypothetical protein WCP65_06045, partial [Bacteroidota bacterium]